jgi:hypothetical protein
MHLSGIRPVLQRSPGNTEKKIVEFGITAFAPVNMQFLSGNIIANDSLLVSAFNMLLIFKEQLFILIFALIELH